MACNNDPTNETNWIMMKMDVRQRQENEFNHIFKLFSSKLN